MDRFDYNHAQNEHYLSTGMYGGDKSRPVAWGSTSSFNDPITIEVKRELVQLIVEPIVDVTTVLSFAGIVVRYLQNGVYTVALGEDVTRVVASTGPVSIKVVASNSEVYVVIDNVTVRLDVQAPAAFEMSISPTSGILYDKIIYNYAGSIDTLIRKDVRRVADSSGVLTPLSNDKWFEPKLIIADDMDRVDDYYVTSRGLTLAKTAAAFYSNTDLIEKSVDAEEWLPVDKVEYHGEENLIFRSKDPSFAVRFFDTNVDQFIVAGATTTVTGDIYKVGDNIGSYFSHDCYRIYGGSLTVEAETMSSVSIMGYIPDEALVGLDPVIDNNGDNSAKIHLYTFQTTTPLTIQAQEIYVSAIGVNLDHLETMKRLTGVSEIAYADEVHALQDGVTTNSDSEYAILDLQWNV